MGLIRKTMSLGSAGMIDFRSDKERIARSTRKTSKSTREMLKLAQQQAAAQPAPQVNYFQQAPSAQSASVDVVERLRQLGELRAAGTITEAEFNRLKADLIR